MRRNPIVTTSLGDGNCRRTIRLTSEPCTPNTIEARMQQVQLLREFAETPEVQMCGFTFFQKMTMSHTGEVWVIELEATSSE